MKKKRLRDPFLNLYQKSLNMSGAQQANPWGTIDEDSYMAPYLRDTRCHAFLRPLPWLHIHLRGRNVVGPYFPPDHRDEMIRFMGPRPGENTRKMTYFFVHEGQVMGPVLTETILDYMSIIFMKYFTKPTFNMIIGTQLGILLHENEGRPIPHDQIEGRFAFLEPIFGDHLRSLTEAVKMVANGPHFRLQFIDL
jgi:hypothetical protein